MQNSYDVIVVDAAPMVGMNVGKNNIGQRTCIMAEFGHPSQNIGNLR